MSVEKKIVGYCTPWSAQAGQRVEAKVSTYEACEYEAQLVRLISGDDRPDGTGIKEEMIDASVNRRYSATTQAIDCGSYARVEDFESLINKNEFTLGFAFYPTYFGGEAQTLLAQWHAGCGVRIQLTDEGRLEATIAGSEVPVTLTLAKPFILRQWYVAWIRLNAHGKVELVSATIGRNVDLRSVEYSSAQLPAPVPGSRELFPLIIAASIDEDRSREKPATCFNFNGKLERPFISKRSLSNEEAWSVLSTIDAEPGCLEDHQLEALWDFSDRIESAQIRDHSGNRHHGILYNLPSRAVKGFHWDGQCMNWCHQPSHYAAIHFCEEDLYDAKWETSFDYAIPDNLKSGIYAFKLIADEDTSYLTFFIRPPDNGPRNKIAFLASTATYIAYANNQSVFKSEIAEVRAARLLEISPEQHFLQQNPEFGLSTYDTRIDSQGVRFSSRLRPILNNGPMNNIWNLNADLHLIDWMEHEGFEYDVITDEDLHREGVELLSHYALIMTGTHPEYVSTPMWNAFQDYLGSGGRLMYMGGNGFYWRIGMSDDFPGAIEVRRSESGARYWAEIPGENYLQFGGEYGGLWRRSGVSPFALVGISTRATGFDRSSYFLRTEESKDSRVAFMFDGITVGERIGDFGSIGGGAAGAEMDAANCSEGTPDHALVVARSVEHSKHMLLVPEETNIHHHYMSGEDNPEVCAEIVFFETAEGGAVCSFGSINWAASLASNGYQNNVSTLTANVLTRFISSDSF